jgi:putative PIN family toxin of toxin-antitoxin system
MRVVLDTNVVISAIFWPGEARRCLTLWARRRYDLVVTATLLAEYREIALRLAVRRPQVDPEPWLAWIALKARRVEPAPLGKQRSRDRDDDAILACAAGGQAELIVSKDDDLLALGKPFGIEIVTPRRFLALFRG